MWIKENIASVSQPFLERNIAKKNENFCDIYEQKQCSILCFDTLILQNDTQIVTSKEVDVLVVSHFKNDKYTIQPQKIYRKAKKISNKLVLNCKVILRNKTCFDELRLILILHDDKKWYHYIGNINLCYQLRQGTGRNCMLDLSLLEVSQEKNENDHVKVNYEIYSLKNEDELHYCFNASTEENKNKYKCVFENKEYQINNYSCILCYKEFINIANLNDHINCNHLYYKSQIVNDINLIVVVKEKEEIDDNYLTGYVLRKDSDLMIHSLQNNKAEYKKITLMFVNNKYKRRHTTNKINLKRKIYKDEIMEDTEAIKISVYWEYKIVKGDFRKIHNIKEEEKEMMQKWNIFVQKNKEKNFVELVRKYMRTDINKKSHIKLLIVFYNKALLSQNEIIELLK